MSYIFKYYFTKPKLNVTTNSKFQSSFNNSNNYNIASFENFPAKVTTKRISNFLTHSVSKKIKGYIEKNETNYFNANFENLANENISRNFFNIQENQEIKSTLEINTIVQSHLSKNKLMDSMLNKTSTYFVDFNKNCKHISPDLFLVCFLILIFFLLIIIFLLIINFLTYKRTKQKY